MDEEEDSNKGREGLDIGSRFLDLEIKTHSTEMEKDLEVRQRRIDAGLVMTAFDYLSGNKHVENCVYDGSPLVHQWRLAGRNGGRERDLCYCPECDVKYDIPVSDEEWERIQQWRKDHPGNPIKASA